MANLKLTTPLARYIFNLDDIRSNGMPRPGPFKPKKGDDLSVFDVDNFDHDQCCMHGRLYADKPAIGRTHVGYVVIEYGVYQQLGLIGVYDDIPPRHVSIGPTDLPEYRREQAKALAGKACARLCD